MGCVPILIVNCEDLVCVPSPNQDAFFCRMHVCLVGTYFVQLMIRFVERKSDLFKSSNDLTVGPLLLCPEVGAV